ncbi:hypothetical protein F5B21DRAFT_505266 [Xylaria acuta]|nr:hypothetical protein F5B21DRAFT_505266 [Xylaria acuta]
MRPERRETWGGESAATALVWAGVTTTDHHARPRCYAPESGALTGYRGTSGVAAGVLRPAVGRGQSQPQRPKTSGWRLLGRCADAAARARDMDTKHARDCRRIPVLPYKTATFPQSSLALDIGAIPVP